MGNISSDEQMHSEIEEIRCQSCGGREIEAGFTLALCHECRTQLSRRPVPVWIKGITVVIVILLVYAMAHFPSTLTAGIHYKRGVQAYADHKNLTAAREFEQASERFPDSTKILARLFLAYYHSDRINEANQVFGRISGEEAEDEEMANQINTVITEMDRRYYADEELEDILAEEELEPRIKKLKQYITGHPENVSGQYYLADSLFDAKQFTEVESIMLKLRESEPDFDIATLLLAAAYRETKQYDKAAVEVQSVLSGNTESDHAYFALSRIELKQHKDEQGLRDAQKAYELNPDNGANIANLALANHYTQHLDERDHLVALLQNRDDYSQQELDQLTSVFNATTAWRD